MESFFVYIQKSSFNMMLFGAAMASGAMLLWSVLAKAIGRGAKEVDTIAAVQLINRRDALVLDVRDGGEYAQGHIPNAKHIPMGELPKRVQELEKFKSRPIVINCANGTRSAGAFKLLKEQGFAEAVVLKGGLGAWQQASMPVEKKSK